MPVRHTVFILSGLLGACQAEAEPGDDAASDGTQASGESEDGEGSSAGEDSGTASTDDGGESSGSDSGGDPSTGDAPPGGCGIDPGITGAVSGQIEAAGDSRRFVLVVPDDYDPERAYPLVFMFHGRGSEGEQFREYAGLEAAADGDALFVYPDGLPQASQGGLPAWELTPGGSDMQLFDVLLAEFSANLCVDPERIFATGHSHGAFFSNSLGCARGDVLRAIAPVAGGGAGAVCEGQVAVWLAHHPDDDVVPLALGEVSHAFWVEQNHCGEDTEAVDPEPCVQHVGCDEGYEVVWCEHTDESMFGPHSWPAFAGPAIWSFFSRA